MPSVERATLSPPIIEITRQRSAVPDGRMCCHAQPDTEFLAVGRAVAARRHGAGVAGRGRHLAGARPGARCRRPFDCHRAADRLVSRLADRASPGKEHPQANASRAREPHRAEQRATEALRESEAQWKEVFEHNPVMYFMVDADGIVLSVNTFGAAQLGYPVSELRGQSVLKGFLRRRPGPGPKKRRDLPDEYRPRRTVGRSERFARTVRRFGFAKTPRPSDGRITG